MEPLVRPTLFALLRYPSRRRVVVVLLAGLVCTVGVAWGCALWSPLRLEVENVERGKPAKFFHAHSAFGYAYLHNTGGLSYSYADGQWHAWRRQTYGVYTDHYLAGWPMYAMRSSVTSLDNTRDQAHDPAAIIRTRWQLPLSEIVSRGPSDQEFPAFMRVEPDRRVPLTPMPAGLLVNTIFYAVILYPVLTLLRYVQLRLRRQARGFEVAPVTR